MGPCFRRDDVRGFDCQTTDTTSRLAARCARVVHLSPAPKRAWGMPGARCTHSPACEGGSAHGSSPQVHRDHPAFPHAMVLTASFALSPVTGLVCHRRSRINACQNPVGPACLRELDASVGASGPHDFTVRSNRLSSACSVSLTDSKESALRPFARKTLPRPSHPIPTFVTMANAPLLGTGCEKF